MLTISDAVKRINEEPQPVKTVPSIFRVKLASKPTWNLFLGKKII